MEPVPRMVIPELDPGWPEPEVTVIPATMPSRALVTLETERLEMLSPPTVPAEPVNDDFLAVP